SMNLLNMGSYMSYALRFGFLNALYFLGGACLAIDGWCYEKGRTFDGKFLDPNKVEEEDDGGKYEITEEIPPLEEVTPKEKPKKKSRIASYICMGVLVVMALFAIAVIALLSLNGGVKAFWSLFIKDEETLKSIGNFSSGFAHSLGGAEGLVIPFVLVILSTAVGGFMVAFRKVSPRFLSYILIAIVGMQVVFLNSHLVAGNASTQHVKVGHYQEIAEILNERDDSYFRVKDRNDKLTACVPFSGNTNSFSVFSSVIDKDNFATYQLLGYLGNGKNSFKSGHNTGKGNRNEDFGDAFIGYKYFVCYVNPNDKDDTVEEQLTSIEKSKPYLKKVMEVNQKGEEVHLKRGDFYVYENTIVFPLGYRVSGESYRFVKPNTNNSSNRKQNQLALYEYLRGEDLMEFTKKDYITAKTATEVSEYLWDKAADVEVRAGKITARVTAEEGEHLLLNFVAVKGYKATLNGKPVELLDNDLKFLSVALEEGENEVVFTYSSPYVKYAAVGFGGGILAVVLLWLIIKKTKLVKHMEGVLTWAGIVVAIAVVAFFMLYPTCVFTVKLIFLLL
ncbi:MAG: YfhO family protein, partial [Clostridia bacterium]|nr:YfhO family protein [Clostridia bacterium]